MFEFTCTNATLALTKFALILEINAERVERLFVIDFVLGAEPVSYRYRYCKWVE